MLQNFHISDKNASLNKLSYIIQSKNTDQNIHTILSDQKWHQSEPKAQLHQIRQIFIYQSPTSLNVPTSSTHVIQHMNNSSSPFIQFKLFLPLRHSQLSGAPRILYWNVKMKNCFEYGPTSLQICSLF
jgi:hypothetical protein